MILIHHYLCPVCRASILPRRWSQVDWENYRRSNRNVICPGCATLLVLSRFEVDPRLPTAGELFAATVECDELEAIQEIILRRRGLHPGSVK